MLHCTRGRRPPPRGCPDPSGPRLIMKDHTMSLFESVGEARLLAAEGQIELSHAFVAWVSRVLQGAVRSVTRRSDARTADILPH